MVDFQSTFILSDYMYSVNHQSRKQIIVIGGILLA